MSKISSLGERLYILRLDATSVLDIWNISYSHVSAEKALSFINLVSPIHRLSSVWQTPILLGLWGRERKACSSTQISFCTSTLKNLHQKTTKGKNVKLHAGSRSLWYRDTQIPALRALSLVIPLCSWVTQTNNDSSIWYSISRTFRCEKPFPFPCKYLHHTSGYWLTCNQQHTPTWEGGQEIPCFCVAQRL